jgi:GAF domain-containing protein
MEVRQRLSISRGSLFYKILLVFILLGVLPSLLLSARLVMLNNKLLLDVEQNIAETQSLPQGMSGQITNQLASEAGAYIFYTFISVAIIAIFSAGGVIKPIHGLEEQMERFRKGEIDSIDDLGQDKMKEGKLSTGDEVQQLTTLFNVMAVELLNLQQGLEIQVQERTQDLEHRARQLQAAAAVAQAAASMRDLDQLLLKITELISKHFDYYHAGIFLMDAEGEFAVLRAANSEGGQRMLEQGHRLPPGETSIVGHVIATQQPRIALDVGKDAVHFRNPYLSATRSEVALPLITGTRLWGVLDVQSTKESAFGEEDIATLQTLANQVAIAIENAHLFVENQLALKKLQDSLEMSRRAYSGLTQDAWKRLLQSQPDLGYVCKKSPTPLQAYRIESDNLKEDEEDIIVPVSGNWDPGMVQAGQIGKTVIGADNTAAIPVKIRDQVTGVVRLRKPDGAPPWSDDEIELVETLSDRLSAALESARLYQETRRRAERERLTGEITSKLRASNDPQMILKTAVRELRQALQADKAQLLIQSFESSSTEGNPSTETGEGAVLTGKSVSTETDGNGREKQPSSENPARKPDQEDDQTMNHSSEM